VFNPLKSKEPTELEKEITRLLAELGDLEVSDEEYGKVAAHLATLYKLKEHDSRMRVSADTKALIAANLIGIAMIIGHERANVITTKAIGFLAKLR
jgi:hypothetical protein